VPPAGGVGSEIPVGSRVHTPPMHRPIEQGVPSGSGEDVQPPAVVSHAAAVWHSPAGSHVTGAPPPHAPPAQVSPAVQGSRSSQALPSGAGTARQVPLAALHVDAAHGSGESHVTTPEPAHTPSRQASPRVQASPSSHGAPSGLATWTHAPAASTTSWQSSGAGHDVEVNRAATETSPLTVSAQSPGPWQAPDQPSNREPGSGSAARVTSVADAYVSEHVIPQSIPGGAETTRPDPLPRRVTTSLGGAPFGPPKAPMSARVPSTSRYGAAGSPASMQGEPGESR
jgi:hypothetical protein